MSKKRTYSAQSVESVRLESLVPALGDGCIVSLDVAKEKFVGALATASGEPLKLFRFSHPTETRQFLDLVTSLRQLVPEDRVRVAMEPTGTYGDAIRYQLEQRGIPVWMVAAKKTHDSQALFDDVRSMHDPKSAVHIAKLCAMDLASRWQPAPETRSRLRALIELRAHETGAAERCFGRLEAMLARHWPEFGHWLDVRGQKSALALLTEYASPARVTEEPAEAAALLRRVSRSRLAPELIVGLVKDSSDSLGMPATLEEEQSLKTLATQARDAEARADALERAMGELIGEDEVFGRLAVWMGTYTAAAIVTLCDPRQYQNARQLEKACGLNLREKSSGEDRRDRVRLRISKRGPSLVRKLLYLFSLRMIDQSPTVRAWYMRRSSYPRMKLSAVTAVTRKLVRAVFHVARGAAFDPNALFDVRRLEVPLREPEGTTLPRRRRASSTPSRVTA